MKTAPNRKASFLFLLAAGALAPYAVSQDLPGIETQVQGEWIAYRGDRFDVKRITKEKVTTTFYEWNGTPLYERTANLTMKVLGSGERRTVVGKGAEWHYLAGGKKPQDALWTTLSFDADKEGWKKGPSGFGYADDDDATVLDDMQDKYLSVFVRREFEIPAGADLKGLSLLINYDDGFILHANGRRLLSSSNVSINEGSGEITVGNHEANGAESFSLAEFAGVFKEGRNVIAIEGINATLDSSDFTLEPQIVIGGSGQFVESNREETHETFRTDHYFKDRTWSGKIDNLQIWDRALKNTEVKALWNSSKGLAKASGDLAQGLIGHWSFDGNLKDSSGNGRHGKGHGDPKFSDGQLGKALELNGDDQYVVLGGKSTDYSPASGSITVSLWFSVGEFDKAFQTLVSLGDQGSSDWRIHRVDRGDTIGFIGARGVENKAEIRDGKLHHLVAITEKGRGVTLYVDNEPVFNNPEEDNAANFKGLSKDLDKQLPVVGANLQRMISLSRPLEGEFIPMQKSLRVSADARNEHASHTYSGLYRRTDHPEEALLIAARAGDLKKVQSLVNTGVDPDATSTNSYTALAYAAAGGHLEMMRFLIDKGADVNKPSRFKKTPLCVVTGTPHLDAAKLLVSKGAKVTLMQNNYGLTHEAVFWRQPKLMEFVLTELKVDPNLKAPNGSTGLHWAIGRHIPGESSYNQVYLDLIKVLLKHGADPMLRFTQGDQELNALEYAADRGLEQALALLKRHMADREN